MSDIKNIFNIGKSSLQASKTAIEVTAQNIANVDTPGYNKKEVILATKQPSNGSPVFFNGVEITEIKRVYDEELSKQITQQQGKSAYWQMKKEYLGSIEEIFNESDELGLNNDLNAFWSAWQKLSTDPNAFGERQEIIASADQLAETFKSQARDLQEIMANTEEETEQVLEQINQILQKIAEFNQEINKALNGQVTEYKDQMDELVENLSQLVNINYWKEENGQVTLSINGHPLVEGTQAFSLTSDVNDQGQIIVQKKLDDGTLIDITDRLTAGELTGLLELHNETIPGYMDNLDKLAFTLAEKVNEQHRAGFGLDGSTDINFFVPPDSQTGAARNLTVNPDLENNLDLIAASSSPDIPNNENALLIAEIKQNSIIQEGSSSLRINDYYSTLQRNIGRACRDSQVNTDHYQTILHNLQSKRSMISDVALDEELANLIKFQQTYNASAKIISTADEMMSTILNLKA